MRLLQNKLLKSKLLLRLKSSYDSLLKVNTEGSHIRNEVQEYEIQCSNYFFAQGPY